MTFIFDACSFTHQIFFLKHSEICKHSLKEKVSVCLVSAGKGLASLTITLSPLTPLELQPPYLLCTTLWVFFLALPHAGNKLDKHAFPILHLFNGLESEIFAKFGSKVTECGSRSKKFASIQTPWAYHKHITVSSERLYLPMRK